MLKKRLIFTLLYDSIQKCFMLSRNFRLQKVGNYDWLKRNYNFSQIAFFIDELVIIDVSKNKRNFYDFCEILRKISTNCYVPITAGGGIDSKEKVKQLFCNGADKIIINSIINSNYDLVQDLALTYGQQAIVASIDIKKNDQGKYFLYVKNGEKLLDSALNHIKKIVKSNLFGEIYLNSINRDGTGQGYDFELLEVLSKLNNKLPVIIAGGAGKSGHILDALMKKEIDACATAHLFNFMGNKLEKTREEATMKNIPLGRWPNLKSLNLGT